MVLTFTVHTAVRPPAMLLRAVLAAAAARRTDVVPACWAAVTVTET
jgi:hypothetical protein